MIRIKDWLLSLYIHEEIYRPIHYFSKTHNKTKVDKCGIWLDNISLLLPRVFLSLIIFLELKVRNQQNTEHNFGLHRQTSANVGKHCTTKYMLVIILHLKVQLKITTTLIVKMTMLNFLRSNWPWPPLQQCDFIFMIFYLTPYTILSSFKKKRQKKAFVSQTARRKIKSPPWLSLLN